MAYEIEALSEEEKLTFWQKLRRQILHPQVMPILLIVTAVALWLLDKFLLGDLVFDFMVAVGIGSVLAAYLGWRRG